MLSVSAMNVPHDGQAERGDTIDILFGHTVDHDIEERADRQSHQAQKPMSTPSTGAAYGISKSGMGFNLALSPERSIEDSAGFAGRDDLAQTGVQLRLPRDCHDGLP